MNPSVKFALTYFEYYLRLQYLLQLALYVIVFPVISNYILMFGPLGLSTVPGT